MSIIKTDINILFWLRRNIFSDCSHWENPVCWKNAFQCIFEGVFPTYIIMIGFKHLKEIVQIHVLFNWSIFFNTINQM